MSPAGHDILAERDAHTRMKGKYMNIHGLQKMTLLDFPGRVACTVFLGGCDLRCPFCHNAELIDGTAKPVMDENELLAFLEKRKHAPFTNH